MKKELIVTERALNLIATPEHFIRFLAKQKLIPCRITKFAKLSMAGISEFIDALSKAELDSEGRLANVVLGANMAMSFKYSADSIETITDLTGGSSLIAQSNMNGLMRRQWISLQGAEKIENYIATFTDTGKYDTVTETKLQPVQVDEGIRLDVVSVDKQTFEYDELDRVKRHVTNSREVSLFEYNGKGDNIDTFTAPDGTKTVTFTNDLGDMTRMEVDGNVTAEFKLTYVKDVLMTIEANDETLFDSNAFHETK